MQWISALDSGPALMQEDHREYHGAMCGRAQEEGAMQDCLKGDTQKWYRVNGRQGPFQRKGWKYREEAPSGNGQSLKAVCISSLSKCLFHCDPYYHFPVL